MVTDQSRRDSSFLGMKSKSVEEKLINFNSDIDTILDWKKEVQDINLNEHNFETALRTFSILQCLISSLSARIAFCLNLGTER